MRMLKQRNIILADIHDKKVLSVGPFESSVFYSNWTTYSKQNLFEDDTQ